MAGGVLVTQRQAMLEKLRTTELFDLLIIGGGATGCGIAVDAASRGLKVALAERGDFGCGTSGKSTKLIHGGLRYLERALLNLDRVDFNLVKDALREREILLRIAPHLCRRLPFIVPLYRHVDMLYFLAGVKLYDLVAGSMGIGASKMVSAAEVGRRFPALRRGGLRGGVLYYDGQFDDARMNLSLALTAVGQGAAVGNYLEVVELVKEQGRVAGARVREAFSCRAFEIRARCVVNAGGPGVDLIRRLDDPDSAPLLRPSLGSHIVLSGRLTPAETAITVPRTSDGRVLFVLPWKGKTLVGTTDRPAPAGDDPQAGDDDAHYLMEHLRRYFDLDAEPVGVLASWAGLRPLVCDTSIVDTARLHRDHLIDCSPSGLLTIAGGKWTTYRKMAEDTVDAAVRLARLAPAHKCRTDSLQLFGAEGLQDKKEITGLDADCAAHLRRSYGTRAGDVAALCQGGMGARLVAGYPYLRGEVLHAARHEFALTALDILARRTGLALLDRGAARAAAPVVIGLMAAELGWDEERLLRERQEVDKGLRQDVCCTAGRDSHKAVQPVDSTDFTRNV